MFVSMDQYKVTGCDEDIAVMFMPASYKSWSIHGDFPPESLVCVPIVALKNFSNEILGEYVNS